MIFESLLIGGLIPSTFIYSVLIFLLWKSPIATSDDGKLAICAPLVDAKEFSRLKYAPALIGILILVLAAINGFKASYYIKFTSYRPHFANFLLLLLALSPLVYLQYLLHNQVEGTCLMVKNETELRAVQISSSLVGFVVTLMTMVMVSLS